MSIRMRTTLVVLTGAMLLVLGVSPLLAEDAKKTEDSVNGWENLADLNIGYWGVSGHTDAFREYHQQDDGVHGGATDKWGYKNAAGALFYGDMKVDAPNDYRTHMVLSKEGAGWVHLDLDGYRTYYNGDFRSTTMYPVDGHPVNPEFVHSAENGILRTDAGDLDVNVRDIHVDNADVKVEAGLALENLPKVWLGYEHNDKWGNRSTTQRGVSTDMGSALSPGAPTPAVPEMDEWGVEPLHNHVDYDFDRIYAGISADLGADWTVSSLPQYEIVRGTESGVVGNFDDNQFDRDTGIPQPFPHLVNTRFFTNIYDYTRFEVNTTFKGPLVKDALTLEFGHHYDAAWNDNNEDATAQAGAETRFTEKALNYIDNTHRSNSWMHRFFWQVTWDVNKDITTWVGLQYRNGHQNSDANRFQDGAPRVLAARPSGLPAGQIPSPVAYMDGSEGPGAVGAPPDATTSLRDNGNVHALISALADNNDEVDFGPGGVVEADIASQVNGAQWDQHWLFDTVNDEDGFAESVGLELRCIPKSKLVAEGEFEQIDVDRDWQGTITFGPFVNPLDIPAAGNQGNWHWIDTAHYDKYTAKLHLKTRWCDWVESNLKYRYTDRVADHDTDFRMFETKWDDPNYYRANLNPFNPEQYDYPGGIGSTERQTHDVKANLKLTPTTWLIFAPRSGYTETWNEVDMQNHNPISDVRSWQWGGNITLLPIEHLQLITDANWVDGETWTRADRFVITAGRYPLSNAVAANYFGKRLEPINFMYWTASESVVYQIDKWTFTAAYMHSREASLWTGWRDTGSLSIRYQIDKHWAVTGTGGDEGYSENDTNNGLNDYNAAFGMVNVEGKF